MKSTVVKRRNKNEKNKKENRSKNKRKSIKNKTSYKAKIFTREQKIG